MDNKEKAKDKKKNDKNTEKFSIDSVIKKLNGKLKEIYGEFKKIIWPDRKELVRHTINVVIVSALIGGVIVLMDLVFSQSYALFVNALL